MYAKIKFLQNKQTNKHPVLEEKKTPKRDQRKDILYSEEQISK